MTDFSFNFQLGLEHILDPKGYDHILFVLALCIVYYPKEWRRVAWLVTAFTLGHSLTLALATFRVVYIPSHIIETLIPVTIVLTCLVNIWGEIKEKKEISSEQNGLRRYALAAGFGLIHGLGFSNFLRSTLPRDVSIWKPLLAFNLGLELGQLVIVFTAMMVIQILLIWGRMPQRYWIFATSCVIAGVAIKLLSGEL